MRSPGSATAVPSPTRSRAASRRPTTPTRWCWCSSTSTASSTTTTASGTPPAMPCSSALAARCRSTSSAAAPRTAWAATSSASCSAPVRRSRSPSSAAAQPRLQGAAPIARGAAAALTERGEGFHIGCSYGAVVLQREAADATEALLAADGRMYAQKHSRRAPAESQSKNVLVQALAERHPDLEAHADGVAQLVEATAAVLGLESDDVKRFRLAAELHDIGKIGIPESILGKPGPLSDAEWEFVRRHTIIGERILLAAPALEGVAQLVRSSHERWDGGGYPDALAGQDIPLGSRVVAIADAFDAMTADRPYSQPRSVADA